MMMYAKCSVTERIVNYLKDGEGYASADHADFYQVTTGAALQSMAGWKTVGNMVLRGKGTETYAIMAGLRYVLPVIADMRYDDAFIDWAASLTNRDGKALLGKDYLARLRGQPLPIRIDAFPDGSVIFPGPLGRISGPPVETKWVDTLINDMTRRGIGIATKISRLAWAAKGKVAFADNSMRRSADIAGLMVGDIANMMGVLTSNMAVARANGTTPVGTMDHWYLSLKVMEYFALNGNANTADREACIRALCHAYRDFMREFPEDGALLLDLAVLEVGLEAAIRVMKEFHPRRYAVRLDSGDLGAGAVFIEERLRAAGLEHIKVSLTGGIRAINLQNLVQSGTPFSITGIGGYFQHGGERGNPGETPINTEIVTKLGWAESSNGQAFNGIKISDMPAKASRGGILDLWVLSDPYAPGHEARVEVDLGRSGSMPAGNVLTEELRSLRLSDGKTRVFPKGTRVRCPMVTLLDNGKYVGEELLSDAAVRERYEREFAALPEELKPVDGNHSAAPVGLEYGHFAASRNMAEIGELVSRL